MFVLPPALLFSLLAFISSVAGGVVNGRECGVIGLSQLRLTLT